ncbi:MAG: phosphate/phosphite/phosphonate ABC transporter substrate-binding protein [Pelagimonas sp.]|uniref:phosphate/phosphite/phosphonate ABC transporter substrate-binding protein n=1 Tax=Pelagimonas sp. TaxID=2073170 RepID=UPI003D6C3CF7
MIAALPMYDRAETFAANDILWTLTRQELGFGPSNLTRNGDLWEHWLSPNLVLAQTCNLPFRLRLHGKVQLVGSPDYRLPGCPPGYYNSVMIARADDPRPLPDLLRARVLINQNHSQSGFAALWFQAADLGISPNITGETGGHVNSAQAVARGLGDLAALDAMSWRLIKRHDPNAASLREVARTHPTPATPYITSLRQDPRVIRTALQRAIANLDQDARKAISLHALCTLKESAYLDLPTPPSVQFAQVNAS